MGVKSKAICYGKSGNQLLKAMSDGAEALGLGPVFYDVKPLTVVSDVDLVIVVNMGKHSRAIRDAYNIEGVPVLVLDAAYIYRDQGYFQVSLNTLNGLPWYVPHDRAEAMGLIAQEHTKGHHVLVCGQKPGDAQHDLDVAQWKVQTIETLSNVTQRPIIYRPHPQSTKEQSLKTSLASNLVNCHCIVTHNSTSAYEAIMAGVPVICDPCAAYAEVCETNIEQVESPGFGSQEKRQEMLDRVGYGQFTFEEMREGLPLKFWLEHTHVSQ